MRLNTSLCPIVVVCVMLISSSCGENYSAVDLDDHGAADRSFSCSTTNYDYDCPDNSVCVEVPPEFRTGDFDGECVEVSNLDSCLPEASTASSSNIFYFDRETLDCLFTDYQPLKFDITSVFLAISLYTGAVEIDELSSHPEMYTTLQLCEKLDGDPPYAQPLCETLNESEEVTMGSSDRYTYHTEASVCYYPEWGGAQTCGDWEDLSVEATSEDISLQMTDQKTYYLKLTMEDDDLFGSDTLNYNILSQNDVFAALLGPGSPREIKIDDDMGLYYEHGYASANMTIFP